MVCTTLQLIPLLLLGCRAENTLMTFNSEPSAEITSHSDGDEVREGYTEIFRGGVSDPDHSEGNLTATWYLDNTIICESAAPDDDGITTCETVVPAEATTLTLEVRDPDNAAGSDQVALSVIPTESPEAEITAPTADGIYYSDVLINFEGIVSDGEDDAADLVASWQSNLDGALDVEAIPNADGEVIGYSYLSEGEHGVELNVTDTTGKTGTASVIVQVGPPNSAPSCVITAPEDGASGEEGQTVVFEATVADADVPADWLAVSWESDKDGAMGESSPDSAGAVALPYSDLSVEVHVITLTAIDELGGTCSDFILYSVGTPPSISVDSPTSGDVVEEGELVRFDATVSDSQDVATDLALSWVSDIDGEFSTQGADSTGAVLFNESEFSTGTHSITAMVTDTDGLYAVAVLSLQVNGIPTAPGIGLTPDPADTTDDLVVTITTDATDPDGDAISYSYAWFADGVLSSASSTASLDASETAKGQTWTVDVTPNDGYSDGPAGSDSVTIDNTAPTIDSVSIDPDPATASDTLFCSYTGYADADGDADVSTLEWMVNGIIIGADGYGAIVGGDTVTCTVTPDDGTDTGTAVSASVTIDNSAPVLAEVTLSPDPAVEGDTLTCTPGTTSDDDGTTSFTYTYAWSVDGSDPGETGSTLSSDYFNRDQSVFCSVTPNDGSTDGDTVDSNTVTIDNTAPSIDAVTITPDPATASDTLFCSYTGYDDADGDADVSTLEWMVNGITIGPDGYGAIVGGDTVTCTVTPDDGTDTGTAVSASVTIDNSAPVLADVTLTPDPAVEGDTLTCTPGTTSDDDGTTSFTYTYAWSVDGSDLGETGSTLSSDFFNRDQAVFCSVTPNDGSTDGDTVDSNTVTIDNTPPTAPEISLSPEEPRAGIDDLFCQVDTDSTDEDGDSVSYSFDWELNGSTWAGSTATTVESGDTIEGADTSGYDEWTCTVTPDDGDEDGPSASATVTVIACDEDGDGYDSDSTSCGGDDCNDGDSAIHPGSGCDWVVHFYAPGSTSVYVVSEEDNEVTSLNDSAWSTFSITAGEADSSLTVYGDTMLRASKPFLLLLTVSTSGGDMVGKARASNGDLLSTELFAWSSGYLAVQNTGNSTVSLTVDSWDGSAWSSYDSGSALAEATTYFSTSWGLYRISASEPVTAYGMHLENIENHYEYAVAADGLLVGEAYLWSIPYTIGAVGLSGLCIDSGGCSVSTSTSSGTVSSHSLSQGEGWTDYVSEATDYMITSTGLITLRDEATPYGYTASDGSTMDTDLVPGTSGVEYDTEFVFNTCVGPASDGLDPRLSDVILIGYSDSTSVMIEEMDSSGAWTTSDSLTLDAGEINEWATDMASNTVLRITSDLEMHVQMSHTSAEFAWSIYSDHYAD